MKTAYLIAAGVAAVLLMGKAKAGTSSSSNATVTLGYSDPFASMTTLSNQIAAATQRNTDYINGTAWATNGNGTPSYFGQVNP